MTTKNKRIVTLSAIGAGLLVIISAVQIAAGMQAKNLDLLFPGETIVHDDGSGLTGDYYDYEADTQEEALKNAQEVTQRTAEEGITLLKNEENALPLAKTQKVTILGYYSWHNNMSGGEDPATTNGAISLGKGIENAFSTNAKVNEIYANAKGDFADLATTFKDVEDTFDEYSTAIITIKRNSGEGNDQSMDAGASEYNRTGLTLNNAELALIDYASKHFEKIVLVINAANTMELGFLDENDPNLSSTGMYTDPYSNKQYDFSKVKAALWAGCCGSQGGTALANILNGTVNPSGHLPDSYIRDLTEDPTYKNFGSYKYDNSTDLNSYQLETFFVEYEEGIYIGYRYYETADYEASKGNYDGFDYEKEVVFPFGYGLSYTDFSRAYEGTRPTTKRRVSTTSRSRSPTPEISPERALPRSSSTFPIRRDRSRSPTWSWADLPRRKRSLSPTLPRSSPSTSRKTTSPAMTTRTRRATSSMPEPTTSTSPRTPTPGRKSTRRHQARKPSTSGARN